MTVRFQGQDDLAAVVRFVGNEVAHKSLRVRLETLDASGFHSGLYLPLNGNGALL